jgi:hypothetical protein
MGTGARGRSCAATCAVRGDRRRGEKKHAAAASCKKDAARTRWRLAIAAVPDETSRKEAAKVGGLAWIVRTALDGLGGFFGPYDMPTQLRERIAGGAQAIADALVMERLTTTGQIANFGGRIPGGD